MKLIILHGYNSGLKSIIPYTKFLKQCNPELDIIIPISSSKRWYDILETKYTIHGHYHEDKDGIKYTASKIIEILDYLVQTGVNPDDIVLLGFSQGGAISTYVGLTYRHSLKAAIGICAYIPLIIDHHEEHHFHKHRNVLLMSGINDKIIKPKYINYITTKFPYIQNKFYDCGHEICNEMIDDIKNLIV